MTLILGSASPRRRAILNELGVTHEVIPSSYDEESFTWQSDYKRSIVELAIEKARPLAASFPDRVILTADTTVVCKGEVINKPKDQDQARAYLKKLSGSYHEVFSAICVYGEGRFETALACTQVKLYTLSDQQMEQYIQTPIPYDKAGGYTIQGMGGLLVERIDGCYYNVLGLPVALVAKLLQAKGYDLWSIACSSHQ